MISRGAMTRFNQVWLLEPHSPQSYWGFGVILYEQGKIDDALAMLERASEIDPSNPRLMADLAWVTGAKAIRATSGTDRALLFSRADKLFATSTTEDANNGHSYSLWAVTLYYEARYAEAWDKVHKAQESEATVPAKFLRMLREKFPEPR